MVFLIDWFWRFLSLLAGLGLSFVFCPADPPRSVPGLVWVIWPFYRGPGHVSEFLGCLFGCSCVFCPADLPRSVPGRGLGNRAALVMHRAICFSCSCVFCPADPPRSVPGHDLGNQAALLRHRILCFSCSLLFRPADPPLGAGGALGNLATPTVALL